MALARNVRSRSFVEKMKWSGICRIWDLHRVRKFRCLARMLQV